MPEERDDSGASAAPVPDDSGWRAGLRRRPWLLFVYRIAVAIAGGTCIALGLVTGPLPGPGGIPLTLLGVAIWSSEFAWAHRVMVRLKAEVRRFQSWSRGRQLAFCGASLLAYGLVMYVSMAVTGVPRWLPQFAEEPLRRLPGLG